MPSAEAPTPLEQLFQAARERPPGQRASFLDDACDDPALRAEIEALLAADAAADARDFLGAPVVARDEEPVGPDLRGQTVGPYTIERLLGSGGMGDVYLAVREQPYHQTVALKVLRRNVRRNELRQRFAVERQILATLDHPGIARLLGGGVTDDGLPYFALEAVQGQRLTTYCDAHRLDIEARLRLFVQVCEAVHFAHQNLVVHRDLKPSNIFVTEGAGGAPTVKLLDFGIAKLLSPEAFPLEPVQTRTLDRVLTPEYAAPEQIRGEPVTTATDVYALGVILHEVLVGRKPYRVTSHSAADLERLICEAPVESLSARADRDETTERDDGTTETIAAADISEARRSTPERLQRTLRGDLESIVLKALRKEPQARYTSAEQLANDIERDLTGQPVAARRGSRLYRAKKYVQRHRAGIAAAALVLVALVGGLGAALWQARAAEAARAETQLALDDTETALARTEAVTDFLQSLFTANDPEVAGGDTLTTMDLMARGVERAEALSAQPEVQAQVLLAIGTTYSRLDQYDRADDLLQRALSIREEHLSPDHPDVAAAMHYLGENSLDIYNNESRAPERLEDAETLLHEALAIRRKAFPAPHLDIVASMGVLASILTSAGGHGGEEGALDEALALLHEARAMVEQIPSTPGDDQEYLVNALTRSLAVALWNQEDYAGAEPVMRELIERYRQTYGEEHRYTLGAIDGLGTTLMQLERYDEAETLLIYALESHRKLGGDNRRGVDSALGNLGSLYRKTGDLDAAEPLFRELMDRERDRNGTGSVLMGHYLLSYSDITRGRGNYAQTEKQLLKAHSILHELYDDSAPMMVALRKRFALLYEAWGKPDLAAQYAPESPEDESADG